ncbi:PD-(D/E)XK nuclease family protein [bacterium]|nr:PD-(D/E)XK nuclease family protein [bacterium]MBU4560864.1 PD-(D/E)XK nuclease family protein [bacterium]MCG2675980.1 PD-(D/E)XK nuclease family protein [bacterium]MCG2677427.1 PD-(D/E)XK nuclease family protein [bacterium]
MIRFEKIIPLIGKFISNLFLRGAVRLSYSKISTYSQCPLKYKYQYIEKRPTKPSLYLDFGSTIHNTLRDYHRDCDPKKAKLEDLMATYHRNWIATAYKDKEEEEAFRERGRGILKAYYEKAKVDPNRVLYLEEFFKVKIGDYELVGRIDRVDRLPDGGWEIIDYKTSRKIKDESELESPLHPTEVQETLQLDIYHIACQENWRREPKRLSIYYLAAQENGQYRPRKVSVSRIGGEAQRIKALKRAIHNIAQGIQKEDFSPKTGPLCGWCDYKETCPEFKEIPDAKERLRLSYSKMSMFQRCPAQYQAVYIDKIPMKPKFFFSFGSSIHTTFEEFYAYDGLFTTPPLRYLLKLYNKHWIPIGYRNKEEERRYYQDGLKMVKDYYQKFIKKGFQRARYLEKYFELPIGEKAIMIGYMDRVDELPDSSHILIDYKTEPRQPTQEDLDNDLQFTTYYWAAPIVLNFTFDHLYFDYLRFGKRLETKRTQEDIDRLIITVDQAAEDIRRATELNDFPRKINKYCVSCDLECPLKEEAIRLYGSLEV